MKSEILGMEINILEMRKLKELLLMHLQLLFLLTLGKDEPI
jgi:hypothetical protein